MKIYNRRYIGSKHKLLQNIEDIVAKYYGQKKCVFADLFAGTGVVAEHFAGLGNDVIVNDILYSNFVSYEAWLANGKYNKEKVENQLERFNAINGEKLSENYFSKIYAGKYFNVNDAKKIGFIREEIEANKKFYTAKEYYMLLTSLMYETDKIANTVGHFEHYLKKEPEEKGVILGKLDIQEYSDVKIFKEDANQLVRKIKCDVAYIDPPYNARQYVNFYHVLENLANWDKPTEFEGKSMKFKRNHLKSGYSQSKAPLLFKDLIDNLDCKLIIVSYNNTYSANSIASNNKIKEEELMQILNDKGKVTVEEVDYQFFNSGKTQFSNHKEKFYICEVK